MTFREEEQKANELAIMNVLLSVVPEDWWSIRLDVERKVLPDGGSRTEMTLSDADGRPLHKLPPEELYDPIEKSAQNLGATTQPWKRARYVARYEEEIEAWRFHIDYEY
jgi:hypothetical protein